MSDEPTDPKQTESQAGSGTVVHGPQTNIRGNVQGHVYSGTIGQIGDINVQLPPVPRLPLQRPERAIHFVDRTDELAQLLQDLQPGHVITLCGPGGMGKTALAAEAVWTLAPGSAPPDRFPDGVLFHSFYNQPAVDAACDQIARTLGEEIQPTPRAAAQRALAGRQLLLILDGAEDADDLPVLLAMRDQCGVLVTSRRHSDAPAAWHDLAPLPPDDAVTLIRQWSNSPATAGHERIAALVGYLPLALRLVGRYLHQYNEPVEEYLAWLEETPLDALEQGERRLESVPLLVGRSLAQVSDEARQLLAVLGLLALAPVDRTPLAVALDQNEQDLRRPLNRLMDYGLLRREGERWQLSHALIHTFAREQLAPPAGALERLADHYAHLARVEREQGLDGYARLDADRPHLLTLVERCAEAQAWEAVRSLVGAVDNYLDIQGHWSDRVRLLDHGLTAARALPHRYDEGAFLGNLGNAYAALGQVETAIEYYQQALAIAQDIGDRRMEGSTLGSLGNAYADLGQVETAIAYHTQALTISRDIGDRRMEGTALGNLGIAYADLGRVETAIAYYTQALTISRDIGDRRGGGTALGNLGNAYYALGQVETAIEYYQQALAIAQDIGDLRSQGMHLRNLAETYIRQENLNQAQQLMDEVLQIAPNHPYTQARLAQLAFAQGNDTEAITRYQQAIHLHTGEPTEFNFNLALPLLRQGQTAKALTLIQERLAALPHPPDVDEMLVDYQRLYQKNPLPGLDHAIQLLQQRQQECSR